MKPTRSANGLRVLEAPVMSDELEFADDETFWAAVRKSATLVRGLPAWTQAGIVLSSNFLGGQAAQAPRKDSGDGT
jgi:hypothetical protein